MFINNLLHYTKREMGGTRSLNSAEALQVDRLRAEVIEASMPHDDRASLAHYIAHDFMELFHGASHPGENLCDVVIIARDKSIQRDR